MIERLLQLPTREKIGLIAALVVVPLYITDLTVVKPLIRKARELDTTIAVEKEQLDRYRKTLAYEDSVKQQYSDVKDLIGISGSEQEAIETFKNEIDELALRNAIRLKSMRHLTPEATEFLITYVVEISDFEAETAALLNFMHMVSQAPGLIRVRQTTLSSQSTDTVINGSMVVTKVMTRETSEAKP